MQTPCLTIALLCLAIHATGQPNQNEIFDDEVMSVQMLISGTPAATPVVDLAAGPQSISLEFDHLGPDLKDYLYTIVHCGSDWTPSDLEDTDYINGYTEDRIENYYSSLNTLTDYTHYSLPLPNKNMRWTKSGNYLLRVFDEDADREPVLQRRFIVVEPRWLISAAMVIPAKVDQINTHQEIDFAVSPRGSFVQNPKTDVKAFVLQNGLWDSALGPLQTNFIRGTALEFDYQGQIVFPAGTEWRFFDLRSLDYRGEHVRNVFEKDDFYEVTLVTDDPRHGRAYLYQGDLNGRYYIENKNPNQGIDQCDYAKVLFSIKRTGPEDDADVYVFGELSDWKLKPEFKMQWDEPASVYYCEPLLKQGYYNYEYLVVDRKSGQPDFDGYEGNWYETSNTYTILVYYRPFGERYDRVMCALDIDSGLK